MKVLFLGPDWYGSNATSMANGLVMAGCDVRVVDTRSLSRPRPLTPSWIADKVPVLPSGSGGQLVISAAEQMIRQWKPDLLFAFKTVRLGQEDLLSLQVPLKVHYSPDDVSNAENITDDYLRFESHWDLVVTTKRHNVKEISGRSGVHSFFVWSAFDPAWHHPVAARAPFKHFRIGFIGNARPDRLDLVGRLAEQYGTELLICGERWWRAKPSLINRATLRGPRYGEAFSQAVSDIRANLVLLNSDNRDTHTCRTFEVPAAGGLVVAERTDEHLELLEDGREALFFSGEEELSEIMEKVRAESHRMDGIRAAGHRRIMQGGNTYAHRATEILRSLA
jgi:hypothetical protein